MRPLLTPYLHRRRIEIIKPCLKGNILDVGCGLANVAQYLDENQHYVGIDVNERIIKELKENYPDYDFYCCDVDKHMFIFDRKFDTIIIIAVIEHLKNPENVLWQCKILLKDDVNLIITTPTPFGDKIHKIGAALGLTSKEAVEEHHKLYSYENMKSLLTSHGFKIYIFQKFELGMNQMFVCRKRY